MVLVDGMQSCEYSISKMTGKEKVCLLTGYPKDNLLVVGGLYSDGLNVLFQQRITTQTLDFLQRLGLFLTQKLAHVFKTACLANHLQCILFDFNGCGLLADDVEQLAVGRVLSDGMNDGKWKLALCQILTKALVVCILYQGTCKHASPSSPFEFDTYAGGLQVHVVIAHLEMDAYNVDERCVITAPHSSVSARIGVCTWHHLLTCHFHLLLALIAPPIVINRWFLPDRVTHESMHDLYTAHLLLLTISMYSSSVGQVRLSLQYSSMPWPRCRLISSSVHTCIMLGMFSFITSCNAKKMT